jgi:predicted ATP-grasp superfamily ATP-dependent carboligase
MRSAQRAALGRKQIVRKVVVVGSFDELRTTFMRLHAPPVSFMVQEIVPGEDTNLVGYLAFWDHDGREVAWLTKRKLRQNPPQFGDGSLQITELNDEIAALSRRLLERFDYRGFVGVYPLPESNTSKRILQLYHISASPQNNL